MYMTAAAEESVVVIFHWLLEHALLHKTGGKL